MYPVFKLALGITVSVAVYVGVSMANRMPECAKNCTVVYQTPDATAMLQDLEQME